MKVEVLEFNILGAKTYFLKEKWIKSKRCHFGGYFKYVKIIYDVPRVSVKFRARVNIFLQPGSIYTDGKNQFMALSYDEITNLVQDVVSFSIPKSLELLSTYSGEIDIKVIDQK